MAVSLNSAIPYNSMQVSSSCIGSAVTKSAHVSLPLVRLKSRTIKSNRRFSHFLVAQCDQMMTDNGESPNVESVTATETSVADGSKFPALETSIGSNATDSEKGSKTSSSVEAQSTPKKVPLTARERLRAARVLSRYSDSKPTKSEIGRSVLDALRESEKGKKGLPQAPTNLLDDSKRGMPKAGLTFDFPGGVDLFFIVFSFVLISTIMFATTYFVWKVGAIHFNE